MSLRPYQTEIIQRIFNSLKVNNSVLLQMPTGTGKTTVFSQLIKEWLNSHVPNQKVLVVVHRKELVDQIIQRLLNFGIGATRVQAGHQTDENARVQVAMIQSLRTGNRIPKNISLIVIDEAHHTQAKSYRSLLNEYVSHPPKLIGVTATPWRLNGEGFEDLYKELITSEQIKWFIETGYLSPVKHLATSLPDLSGIGIDPRMKDYIEKDLYKLVSDQKIMSDLVDSYLRYANGKKCIVFALNRKHSMDIVNRFSEENIAAAYIDADTSPEERAVTVTKFKNGELRVLCNVNIFTEGFDCPDVEVVQLARPTKSFSMYLQQIGRVMRPTESKEYGLILDNALLWKEHGLVTQPISWALNYSMERIPLEIKAGNSSSPIRLNQPLPLEILGLELTEVTDQDRNLNLAQRQNNEPQDIRVSKLAQELNTSPYALIDYIKRNIERINNLNPNTKIRGEYIAFIRKNFEPNE